MGYKHFDLPPGVSLEEFNAQSRVVVILAGSIIPFGIATLFVFARFYSRIVLTRLWKWDDNWVLISWVGSLIVTIINCVFINFGAGRHMTLMKKEYVAPTLILVYCVRIIYQFTLTTTQISILTLYLRVFSDDRSRRLVFGLLVLVALYSIVVQLTQIFQCRPVYDAWSPSYRDKKTCLKSNTLLYLSTGLNITVNILIVAFTYPRIIPLNIPRSQKIALLCLTSLSILVIIAAIIRCVRSSLLARSHDYSWDSYDIVIWSSVEANVGIFCACAPVLKPLIRRLLGLFSSSFASSESSSYGPGTYGSHGRRGVELRDADFHGSRTNNTIWSHKSAVKETVPELSDSDSTKAVLEDGKITRTIVVRVNREDRGEDEESGIPGRGV